jgi:aspartyl-tRNA(Asn)/glutamyl-tRNA(Gln) amidotransferase subunit B
MRLEPIIGLETHVQLKTKTKLFCGCDNASDNAQPNTNICSICTGQPGVLPVPNEQAIKYAVMLSLALNGKIAHYSKFDRKHYFYPDLPKAYQISQYDLPVMQEGFLKFEVEGREVKIRIERLHLEEDAAKNIHGADGKTYVDYNRGGTPLCEIVTGPDIRSSAEAKKYLQEMRAIVRALGVSDADMEKGHLRCDVNISLREIGENGKPIKDYLSPKTEIKNVNSFRAVERAIEFEIERQTKLWEAGNPPSITTTRGWDDDSQQTTEQRTKEGEADYRYFPEPDIPPMILTELASELSRRLPELPRNKVARFISEYEIKRDDAELIAADLDLANFTEHVLSELEAWLKAQPNIDADQATTKRKEMTKVTISWLLNKLGGLLIERKIGIKSMKISPENFAELMIMIEKAEVTGTKAFEILGIMLESGEDPSHIADDIGAKRVDDSDALTAILNKVIEDNPGEYERFKSGDTKLVQFFIGQMMRETRGNADPQVVTRMLNDRLN